MDGLTVGIHRSQNCVTISSISLSFGANLEVNVTSAEGIVQPRPNSKELGVKTVMSPEEMSCLILPIGLLLTRSAILAKRVDISKKLRTLFSKTLNALFTDFTIASTNPCLCGLLAGENCQ